MHNVIWRMSPLDQYSAFLFLHWKWDGQTSVSLGCEVNAGKDLDDELWDHTAGTHLG